MNLLDKLRWRLKKPRTVYKAVRLCFDTTPIPVKTMSAIATNLLQVEYRPGQLLLAPEAPIFAFDMAHNARSFLRGNGVSLWAILMCETRTWRESSWIPRYEYADLAAKNMALAELFQVPEDQLPWTSSPHGTIFCYDIKPLRVVDVADNKPYFIEQLEIAGWTYARPLLSLQ